MICGWGDDGIPEYNFASWNGSHPMLEGLYYRLYFGITLTNMYLDNFSGEDATMTAEARFLRALHYYYLLDGWGNVPIVEHIVSENPSQPEGGRADLYAYVEKELTECVKDMAEPKARTSADGTYGRADKAAAWLLLSRLYANAEVYTGKAEWQKAKEYAQMVMNSDYELSTEATGNWTGYQKLFMGDNGESSAAKEILLPILADGQRTAAYGLLFPIAATWSSEMYIYDETQTGPGLSESWSGNRCRPDLVNKFVKMTDALKDGVAPDFVAAAHDDRALFFAKGRKFDIDANDDFKKGLSTVKFCNYRSDAGSASDSKFNDTDYPFLRKAEAYLLFAEADAHLNGGKTSAEGAKALNAIRNRANAGTSDAYSLDDICDEWAREFYFEGYRRSTLIRFGKFAGSDYLWQWKGGSYVGAGIDAHYQLYAIPEKELNANSKLKQNPGY